jgi:hypothetical protein
MDANKMMVNHAPDAVVKKLVGEKYNGRRGNCFTSITCTPCITKKEALNKEGGTSWKNQNNYKNLVPSSKIHSAVDSPTVEEYKTPEEHKLNDRYVEDLN